MGRIHRLERAQLIGRPLEEVFAFFSDAANLERLTPPFLRFRILTPPPIEMRPGTRIDYALSLHGVPIRWRARISCWHPETCFVDEQESGPYAFWRHTHMFERRRGTTRVRDVVEYAEPLGPLGRLAHALLVKRSLERIFDFRRDTARRLLEGSREADSTGPEDIRPVRRGVARLVDAAGVLPLDRPRLADRCAGGDRELDPQRSPGGAESRG